MHGDHVENSNKNAADAGHREKLSHFLSLFVELRREINGESLPNKPRNVHGANQENIAEQIYRASKRRQVRVLQKIVGSAIFRQEKQDRDGDGSQAHSEENKRDFEANLLDKILSKEWTENASNVQTKEQNGQLDLEPLRKELHDGRKSDVEDPHPCEANEELATSRD